TLHIDSIREEDLGRQDLAAATFYTDDTNLVGHPMTYNIYEVFNDQDVYSKAFGIGTEEEKLMTWRIQHLEQNIPKLELKRDDVSSLLQISDQLPFFREGAPDFHETDRRDSAMKLFSEFFVLLLHSN
ncbi:PATL6, partial [Linum perenne]